ncbi:10010_t:CDS:2 [Cetraspora pellucida]|uniref:10010_t:CDS:1 n=1 Tax=Cetraspora pellucida TaxID=1433469 RepID=A0A9N9IEV1_9GLOM|nr:10010_t:CDS:2 [Cetraspora pellucida]
MSRHHTGSPERHRFTNDIIVLGTKPTNKYNTYCVCKACDEILGREETLKNPITNKKNIVRNHLKNCEHFHVKKGLEEAVKIYCNKTDDEEQASQTSIKHQNADTLVDNMNDETFSVSSTPSTPKKQRKKPLNSNTISNFIVKDVSVKDKPKFERLLLQMTISNGWAFKWTTNQATWEFFEFLNPALTLPARHALLNCILDAERNNFIKSHEQKLREDVIRKNILKQNIFGLLFILSTGEVQVWEAIDVSSERERMIDIISKIKKMINDASNIGTKLLAIVSDSASAYSAARVHSYFIGKLRVLQKQTYSKYIALICPGNTRWNSYFYCFKSLIKSWQALRNLATTFESPLTYDSNNEESNSSDELYLPQNITLILLNDNFWQSITQLSSLLLPYCGALNSLQSDTARLYNMLQAFGGILRMWQEYSDYSLAQHIIQRLEQRWKQWKQPLLLLAFLLNPNIYISWFNANNKNLNFTYLAQFVTYYYKAWFGHQPICILLELEDYRKQKYPFDSATYKQFGKNILGFWEFASFSSKELGPLALHLFEICVNAASVERLWSSMGFIHTNCQNRLTRKQVHTYNIMYSQSSAPPIGEAIPNKFEADLDEEHNELYDIEPSNLENWKNQLHDWEQMLTDEETARLEDKEEEHDNYYDSIESDLLSDYTHPVVDDKAK